MAVIHGSRSASAEERIWFNGALVTIRVSSAETGKAFNLLEVLARAGHATPLHRDPNCETFLVLEGELLFHIAGQETRAAAGDTVVVPKGVPHAFMVVSPVVRYVLLNVPGGQDEFFRVAGEPAVRAELPPPAPPDFARISAAAGQFGIEILGPPPFAKVNRPRTAG